MTLGRWTENRCRAEVYARSGRLCELGGGRAAELSHRLPRSRGGGWEPWNVIHVSSEWHRWWHANPSLAYAGGWHLQTGDDPRTSPVWLERPCPGWFTIEPCLDGGPHVLVPFEVDLAPPPMPDFADTLARRVVSR